MTTNHAAAADYQSLYSEKRRDLDVFNVCKHTFIFYPKSTISSTLMATAGFYYTVATKLYSFTRTATCWQTADVVRLSHIVLLEPNHSPLAVWQGDGGHFHLGLLTADCYIYAIMVLHYSFVSYKTLFCLICIDVFNKLLTYPPVSYTHLTLPTIYSV